MPTINQLAQIQTLTGADQIPVYSASNGDARKASLTTLLDWIETTWMSPDYQRVTASPTLAGFTLALPTTASSLFVLLTPTGTMATGTITLPPASGAADGQEIIVYSTQEITVLTLALNGATAVSGAPSGVNANSSLTLRFDAPSATWFTIQKPTSAGTGTVNFVPKWTAPSTLGNSLIEDNGTAVGVGGAPTIDRLTVYGTAQATAADSSNGFNAINSSSTAARFPGFRVYNYAGAFAATCETVFQASTARGTSAAPAALLSGDRIGTVSFWGHNGVDFFSAANVYARATSNWAAARASELYFQTTNAGTTADRLRISPAGNVELAASNTVFNASGAGQGVRLAAAPSSPDPNVLDAYEEGAFTPVYNGTGIVGTVTFAGRYQRVGNQITLEITISVAAASSLTFTTATDWFDNFPAAITPSVDTFAGNALLSNAVAFVAKTAGTFRAGFQIQGAPTVVFSPPTSGRYTIATYLV